MKTLFLMMILFTAFITVAKADLSADIAAHNARCANVQAGSPEEAQCQQEQAALDQRRANGE
jgi:hypothetical protein